MNRLASKSVGNLLAKRSVLDGTRRPLSSGGGSGKAKGILILGTGAIAATGATYAYAKYDKEFSDQLVSYMPFTKELFAESKPAPETPIESFMKKNQSAPKVEKPRKKAEPVLEAKSKPETSAPPLPAATTVPESSKPKEVDIKKAIEETMQENKIEELGKRDENEVRTQVKRMIYAFNEFYEEKRLAYETELQRQYEIEMKERLIAEKGAIMDEYLDSFKKLKQMENLLNLRDQLDKQEKASKKLWILSQTLSRMLHHEQSLDIEAQPVDIEDELKTIKSTVKANFKDDALMEIALNSLSDDVVSSGVYSEEDLIHRFKKVEKICNQVALIKNEYTPFYMFLYSAAHSFIRPLYEIDFSLSLKPIQIKQIPQGELDGSVEVDPTEWDTYDILKRVNYCIEHRNLEQALRYANQLTGEPRRVARDWISDTRKHLEVKQTLDLIQSKISAMNIQQYAFTH